MTVLIESGDSCWTELQDPAPQIVPLSERLAATTFKSFGTFVIHLLATPKRYSLELQNSLARVLSFVTLVLLEVIAVALSPISLTITAIFYVMKRKKIVKRIKKEIKQESRRQQQRSKELPLPAISPPQKIAASSIALHLPDQLDENQLFPITPQYIQSLNLSAEKKVDLSDKLKDEYIDFYESSSDESDTENRLFIKTERRLCKLTRYANPQSTTAPSYLKGAEAEQFQYSGQADNRGCHYSQEKVEAEKTIERFPAFFEDLPPPPPPISITTNFLDEQIVLLPPLPPPPPPPLATEFFCELEDQKMKETADQKEVVNITIIPKAQEMARQRAEIIQERPATKPNFLADIEARRRNTVSLKKPDQKKEEPKELTGPKGSPFAGVSNKFFSEPVKPSTTNSEVEDNEWA